MYYLHCTTLSRLSEAKKKTNDLTFLRYFLFCYFLHRQLQSKKTNQIRKKGRQTLDSCTIYTIYLQAIYVNLVTVCRQPRTYVTSMLTSFAKKLYCTRQTKTGSRDHCFPALAVRRVLFVVEAACCYTSLVKVSL